VIVDVVLLAAAFGLIANLNQRLKAGNSRPLQAAEQQPG
jgi:hypothetical protein